MMGDKSCKVLKVEGMTSPCEDWRARLTSEARQKVVKKIYDRLGTQYQMQSSSNKLNNIAVQIEDETFRTSATRESYANTIAKKITEALRTAGLGQTSVVSAVGQSSETILYSQPPSASPQYQQSLFSQPSNSTMFQQNEKLRQQHDASEQQQWSMPQQNVVPSFQQPLGQPRDVSGTQHQQNLAGPQSIILNLQLHQSSNHMIQQQGVTASEQKIQKISQPVQLHQILGSQKQSCLSLEGIQRIPQTSEAFYKQKLFQSQRSFDESASGTFPLLLSSVEPKSSSQVSITADGHDEVYQKLQEFKRQYRSQMEYLYKNFKSVLEKATDPEKAMKYKKHVTCIEKMMPIFSLQQNQMANTSIVKLERIQQLIIKFVNYFRKKSTASVEQQAELCLPTSSQSQISQPPSTPSTSTSKYIAPNQVESQTKSHNQSTASGTPEISASPLLEEFTCPSKSSDTNQPLQRLLRAVKSLSPEVLSAAVHDIDSVVTLVDKIAGRAAEGHSNGAIGEDSVSETLIHVQEENFASQHLSIIDKKMEHKFTAMASDTLGLPMHWSSDFDSSATSRFNKLRTKPSKDLVHEIRSVNQQLVETTVDVDSTEDDYLSEASEGGAIIKCSYKAVAVSGDFKSLFSSPMFPELTLSLLVPADYPNSSPVILDRLPVGLSEEPEDLLEKTKLRFSTALRNLSEPMSLLEIAKTWDACARAVLLEYVKPIGGECFSSRYGTCKKYLTA